MNNVAAQSHRCIVALAMVLITNTARAAPSIDVLGNYVSMGEYSSTMAISTRQELMHVELKGGSSKKDLASVASDCEAVAEGPLSDGVIRAKLVPFEGEVTSLDRIDIERIDSTVIISFGKAGATVQGSFAHCGLRNALNGRYKRQVRDK